MAIIKEFKALLYDSETVGDMSSVVAPHCHAEEQELIGEIYGNHPFNVMRLEHPAEDDAGVGNKYIKTAETLKNWLETGIVKIDSEPAIYIYEQEYMANEKPMKVRGIVCKVKIEEGILFPHEDTNTAVYSEYKSDRYNLMAATGTTFSSIYSMYRDESGEVAAVLDVKEPPELEFTDDYDVTHRVWAIHDAERIAEIKEIFKNKQFVIADGHVRYETAVNYYKKMRDEVVEYTGNEEFNYVMMNLMPVAENAPMVIPVHRLVKNKAGFNEEEFVEKLEQKFEVVKSYIREYDCEKITARLAENKERRALALYTGKDYYYLLIPGKELADSVNTDTELLHKEILCGLLNINRENFKNYVSYAYSVEDGERAVRENKANCAFYLNPLTSGELYGLAECGIRMPKRTNMFYPRLMTGIVMNKFDE